MAEAVARLADERSRDRRAEVREVATRLLLTGVASLAELPSVVRDVAAGARRAHACWLLGCLALDEGIAALTEALTDPDPVVRQAAASALGAYGGLTEAPALLAAVPTLIDAMRTDSDVDVRSTIVWIVGQHRVPAAIDALVALLQDAAPELRAGAAIALGKFRPDDAPLDGVVAALVEAMRSGPDPRARETSAWALGGIGDPAVTEALLAVLANAQEGPGVRGQAAESLGSTARDNAAAAIPGLLAALGDPEAEVRYHAAFALAQLGDATVVPALEHMAAHDDGVLPVLGSLRDEAQDALDSIRRRMEGDDC